MCRKQKGNKMHKITLIKQRRSIAINIRKIIASDEVVKSESHRDNGPIWDSSAQLYKLCSRKKGRLERASKEVIRKL